MLFKKLYQLETSAYTVPLSLVLFFSHLSPHWPVQLYFLFRLKLVVNTLKLDVTYLISSFSQKIGKLRNIVSHSQKQESADL